MSKQHGRLTFFPAAAVTDTRLGSAAFRVLAALGRHGDKDGWCYPSLKTLADDLGISKQAISKSIQQLVALGYVIVRQQHRADGSRTVNQYRLVLDYGEPTHQPDVDRGQPDVDTRQPLEVDTHQPNGVDTHQPLEVDAVNVPLERPKKNDPSGRVRALPRPTLETYTPDDALLATLGAERPDLDLAAVIDNWRDYHREHGTTIKDFNASLRRWVRNEKPPRFAGRGRGQPEAPVLMPNGQTVDASTARLIHKYSNLRLAGE